MTFVVPQNKPPAPIHVSLLGSYGVMPHADLLPDLVEQARRPCGGRYRRRTVFMKNVRHVLFAK
ncbi:MAG: hypothetical protein A2W18_12395 [Candidatus Muproteobacteria bacterium RBG_16_60_9]|uniref:Uncharacterized protein n=1 Tax=Candidatus Muproteobacteria bacterium RBG_16_60_9 TaxID=1817755 RepID=A0A1F6UVG8_9PROT|nr:MAG: hypothetical protein A2W18_12395 [Candidatus Muproteobacteria bacterium RBG_16_60_9]